MFDQDTTTLVTRAIAILFYLLMAIFALSSSITIYSLISYGKQKAVILGVTVTYIAVGLVLFLIALSQLHNIQF